MTPIRLDVDRPIWDRFFTVAPLVIVGSKEADGTYDLAPKHMAMPLGWQNYYAFVCSPRHGTYRNVRRERQFTVSFPRPTELIASSLAASPRCEDDTKPALALLSTQPATAVDGVLVSNCYVHLECVLHSMLDGFGANSLIIGEVVAASADEDYVRMDDRDPGEQLYDSPLLAYISPGRYATIRRSAQFPVPEGFTR